MKPRALLRIGVLGLVGMLAAACVTPTAGPQPIVITPVEARDQPVIGLSLGSVTMGTTDERALNRQVARTALSKGLLQSNMFTASASDQLDVELRSMVLSFPQFATAFRVTAVGSYVVKTQSGHTVYETAVTTAAVAEFSENFIGAERIRIASRRAAAANFRTFTQRLSGYLRDNAKEVVALVRGDTDNSEAASTETSEPERTAEGIRPEYTALRYLDSRTNLRAGPGTGHDVLGVLARGSKVEVAEANGEWRAVRTDAGDEGYIFARLLLSEDDYASRQAARATAARQSQEAPKPAPAEPVSSEPAPAADQATAPPVAIAPSLMLIDPPWKAGSGDQITFVQAGPTIIIGRIVGEATELVINDRPVPLKAGGFFQAEVDVAAGETFRYALHYGNDQNVSSEISVKIE